MAGSIPIVQNPFEAWHGSSSYKSGLLAYWRALRAIIRREWIIFRRYPSWIVALLIWPVIFPMAYILTGRALAGPNGGGLLLFNRATGTPDFIGFIVVGTTIWMWQNVVLWNVGFTLREEQKRGTLETSWMAPTWRFSFLLGSSATQLVVMLLFIVISALEYGLLFGVRFNGNPLLVLLMLLVCIPSIYGLGFAFASLVIAAKEASAFVYLVRGLVMIFCGITFPVALLPLWMQAIARWLPPTYMIEGIRKAVLEGAGLPVLWPYIRALLLFGILWLAVGYILFSWMERRARLKGTLSQY
jgi:ABC-2 type transport system permease protein